MTDLSNSQLTNWAKRLSPNPDHILAIEEQIKEWEKKKELYNTAEDLEIIDLQIGLRRARIEATNSELQVLQAYGNSDFDMMRDLSKSHTEILDRITEISTKIRTARMLDSLVGGSGVWK